MTHDDTGGALSETVSFKLSDALNREIETQLDGPHQKSEWVRDACREKLAEEQQEPAEPTLK